MTVGKFVEWALIIIAGIFALRWISNAFNSGGTSLNPGYQASTYPYRLGGGVVYFGPGLTQGGFYPAGGWYPSNPRAPWRPRRGYNG